MPKTDDGAGGSIPRMLKMAFRRAQEGNEKKAWSFWRSAISRGYAAPLKVKRQLEIEINRVRRENGLPEHPITEKPHDERPPTTLADRMRQKREHNDGEDAVV